MKSCHLNVGAIYKVFLNCDFVKNFEIPQELYFAFEAEI